MKGLTVYQIVHTLAGQLYHLNEHLKVIFESYYELFGGYLKIDKALITKEINDIIARAQCPRSVSLFIMISSDESGSLKVAEHERSLYCGYNLRCVTPRAALVPFDLPFAYHSTSIRLSLTTFANIAAKKKGADIALRSLAGEVDMANCAQLFAVSGSEVITAATSHSVEHKFAKEAIRAMGLQLTEAPITEQMLSSLDELFYADHYGITAIKSCSSRYYMSITAAAVAAALKNNMK